MHTEQRRGILLLYFAVMLILNLRF